MPTQELLPNSLIVSIYCIADNSIIISVSKNLPLRGRCPVGAEGENLAIARNISDCRTVLSPTACGRSPLAEGAKGGTHLFDSLHNINYIFSDRLLQGVVL